MFKTNKKISKKELNKEDNKNSDKIENIKFTILAIVCIVLFSATLAPITFQNDTYYTIKIGEHIIQTGEVDMQEPFSWHENLPYTYPHWAYDVMIYLIYHVAGFTGIYISTIILSCILGVVMYFTNVKISKNRLVSFLITMGSMFLLKDYIAARAQLVTFILLELIILFIENFLETKKKRYAVGIILTAIVIANVHAAVWPFIFVLFLPYIAEYILNFDYIKFYYKIKEKFNANILKKLNKKIESSNQKEKIKEKIEKINKNIEQSKINKEKAINNREKRRKNPYRIRMTKIPAVKWLILIMVICVFTGLITPIGDTPYTWTYRTMQGNTTDSISEHLPLTLINNKPMLITLVCIIAILSLTDVKIRLKDLFMIAGLALLMFMTRRQESMFILFGSAVVAKLIADLFEKYDKDGTMEFQKIMTSVLGIVATILVTVLFMIIEIKGKVGNEYVRESSYPTKAAEYIKENIDLSSMRLFNEYNYGSYLLFEGIPVFIDSRADLYTPEFNKTDENPEGRDIFTDYINTSNISKDYEKTFEKYDITHIILNKKSKLNMLLTKDSKHYIELYSDEYFVVYEREVD